MHRVDGQLHESMRKVAGSVSRMAQCLQCGFHIGIGTGGHQTGSFHPAHIGGNESRQNRLYDDSLCAVFGGQVFGEFIDECLQRNQLRKSID